MKLTARTLFPGIIIIVTLFACFYLGAHTTDPIIANISAHEPVIRVQTQPLKKNVLHKTLHAYGVVLPLPDKLQTVSVSYPCQIEKILVNPGQLVPSGAVLLSLKPGPTALLQWHKAQTELLAALRNQKLLQQRLRLKLATRQDLVGAQLRVDQAKVTLKNLTVQGVGKSRQISAQQAGIIYQVNVQQGQQLAAGAPLLQMVAQNQWVVRLGIEPEDYKQLQINQPVLMTPVNTPVSKPVKGRIEIITHQIDPATRLLNVFVRPELNQTLLMNDFVKAQIIIATVNAFSVPRNAVLPDAKSYSLFTVKQGHAIKHRVKLGIETNQQIEVSAPDLIAQDEVVVSGNYELQSGMTVLATSVPPTKSDVLP